MKPFLVMFSIEVAILFVFALIALWRQKRKRARALEEKRRLADLIYNPPPPTEELKRLFRSKPRES